MILANEAKFTIQPADLTGALKALDKEGMGKVSQTELFNLLQSSGESVTAEELKAALEGFALDGNEIEIDSLAKFFVVFL